MGVIRVTVEFDDNKLFRVGGLPIVPDNKLITRYGIEVSDDADAYELAEAVQTTIATHRDGRPQLNRLEDFN